MLVLLGIPLLMGENAIFSLCMQKIYQKNLLQAVSNTVTVTNHQ